MSNVFQSQSICQIDIEQIFWRALTWGAFSQFFLKMIFIRCLGVLYQLVLPESNLRLFRYNLCMIALFGFFLKLAFDLQIITSKQHLLFHKVSFSHSKRFDKLIFRRFCSALCQPVHPESSLRYFQSFICLIVLFRFF